MNKPHLYVRRLGLQDYTQTWQAMRQFTLQRTAQTPSELWVVEHPPVFTQGQAGKPEHLLDSGDIPVIQTDRGGQITYHAPGQLVIYLLLSLREAGLGVRALVSAMENAVVHLLADYAVDAKARADAPGVYVGQAKIAALGLRIKRGYSYHGLALNVDMDLAPFQRIHPCGYPGMPVTQTTGQGMDAGLDELAERLVKLLGDGLGYTIVPSYEPLKPVDFVTIQ